MSGTITIEQLMAELERVSNQNAEGETMDEMRARLGIGTNKLYRQLRVLVDQGRVVVGRRMEKNIIGSCKVVPCYRVVPKRRKKR